MRGGEADNREVPAKCPNKGGKPLVESMEAINIKGESYRLKDKKKAGVIAKMAATAQS